MKDLEKIKVTRLVYDVPKSEVDEQVEHVAEATRAYKSKKGKASIGDRITVNLNGKISEVVPAGVGSERTLVLGENELIPCFEEQLVGAKAGDEKMITVEFPTTFDIQVWLEKRHLSTLRLRKSLHQKTVGE